MTLQLEGKFFPFIHLVHFHKMAGRVVKFFLICRIFKIQLSRVSLWVCAFVSVIEREYACICAHMPTWKCERKQHAQNLELIRNSVIPENQSKICSCWKQYTQEQSNTWDSVQGQVYEWSFQNSTNNFKKKKKMELEKNFAWAADIQGCSDPIPLVLASYTNKWTPKLLKYIIWSHQWQRFFNLAPYCWLCMCACAHVYKCEFDIHAWTFKLWLGSQLK